jgi:hypothetical protein
LLEMLPAVAMNVAEVAPAGTVTDVPGTGNSVLLLDSNISVPPVGAAMFNVTVHVVVPAEFKLAGVQASWETESICPNAMPQNKKTAITDPRFMLNALIIGV